MGSIAYGVSTDASDYDVYGFCIPPKSIVFPHLDGQIEGFGRQKQRFDQYQQHHILCQEDLGGRGRNYDLSIYSIIKYFQLCMDNNPNMVDSLFVPINCILHSTQIGQLVRENRKLFLHKGCFQKFKGYAYSQLSKASNVANNHLILKLREYESKHSISHTTTLQEAELLFQQNTVDQLYIDSFRQGVNESKRFESQKIYNTDLKFLYHIVRLVDECEQILTFGDLDLQRSKEQMKAVRKGELQEEEIKKWFNDKERQLEALYNKENSPIPYSPPEEKIKQLLLKCLEIHYGSLDKCIVEQPKITNLLEDLTNLVVKYRK